MVSAFYQHMVPLFSSNARHSFKSSEYFDATTFSNHLWFAESCGFAFIFGNSGGGCPSPLCHNDHNEAKS
jgi:hypothetical protein